MKRARPQPAPKALQPGHYLFWQQRTYQVLALDPDNALLLHVQPLTEGSGTTLSLLDLLAVPRTSPFAPLFAPTLQALHQQIEEQYGSSLGTTTHDLPDSFVIKARIVTTVVEMVRRLVSEEERRAQASGEPMAHKQAIRRALSTMKKTTIRMEVRGTSQEIQIHASLTSYYKYERLYTLYHGDEAQIAASFRRSTFRLPHVKPAQFHFIDGPHSDVKPCLSMVRNEECLHTRSHRCQRRSFVEHCLFVDLPRSCMVLYLQREGSVRSEQRLFLLVRRERAHSAVRQQRTEALPRL